MGKLSQLKGTAHNLADSFISITNRNFLNSLPFHLNKQKLLEIDLLKEKISPSGLSSKSVKETINYYKRWFLSEIEKMNIKIEDIKSVSIKVSYKADELFSRYYTCNVTVKTKNKEHSAKTFSIYR